jgi:phosphatidate cytidylyltransferase
VLVPATWEIAVLGEHRDLRLPRGLMIVAASAVLLSSGVASFPAAVALLAAVVVVGVVLVGEARPDQDVMRRAGVMLLPALYVALPLAAMVVVRREHGAPALLLLLATIMVSDTAQYYGGRLLGRRPLAPRISPKKTIEGAVAGVLAGSLVLPVAGGPLVAAPWWIVWPAALAIVGLGIAGDLFESLLKRSAGVKDSSGLIPGHGGVLDRIDSLLFAAPFYYILLESLAWSPMR